MQAMEIEVVTLWRAVSAAAGRRASVQHLLAPLELKLLPPYSGPACKGSFDLCGAGHIVTRPKALQVAGTKGMGRNLGSLWQFM